MHPTRWFGVFPRARGSTRPGRRFVGPARVYLLLILVAAGSAVALLVRSFTGTGSERDARAGGALGSVNVYLFAGVLLAAVAAAALLRDHRARKRYAEELGHLASTVQAAGEAIVRGDANGIITSWNRGAERMYGYTADEMIGRGFTTFVPTETIDELLPLVKAGARFEALEVVAVRKDGSQFDISLSLFPIVDADGRVVAISSIAADITERKQMEEMRAAFLTAVSHELRTPLTALLGFARMMSQRGDALDKSTRDECVNRLVSSGERLEHLIGDLLDLNLMGRGTLEPLRRDVTLRQLLEAAVEQVDLCDRTVSVEADPFLFAEIDTAQAKRIVESMLHNAAKHTPPDARVWVKAEPFEVGVMFVVEDDGPGVPEDLRAEIFKPMRQGRTVSSSSPGAGLGLSLVASFAQVHRGRAWVEERPGGGASFRAYLPARITRPKRWPPPPQTDRAPEGDTSSIGDARGRP